MTDLFVPLKVQLVAQMRFTAKFIEDNKDNPFYQKFQFINDEKDDNAAIVEFGGRTCYMSFENPRPGGREAYIENIMKQGHGSVLEAANYTFYIEGVSRTLTHELVRHRAGWAYSQLSQRFVDAKDTKFVVPPLIDEMEDSSVKKSAMFELEGTAQHALSEYIFLQNLLKENNPKATKKQINEVARAVLPNMTETKIQGTCNARALRHFLTMRGSLAADAEIRRLAIAMYKLVKDDLLFADFSMELTDNVVHLYCKFPKI